MTDELRCEVRYKRERDGNKLIFYKEKRGLREGNRVIYQKEKADLVTLRGYKVRIKRGGKKMGKGKRHKGSWQYV